MATAATLRAIPNPFSGGTTLHLTSRTTTSAQVEIFDAGGRLVRRLWHGTLDPGGLTVSWDGRDQSGLESPAGIYLLLQGSDARAQGMLVKIK